MPRSRIRGSVYALPHTSSWYIAMNMEVVRSLLTNLLIGVCQSYVRQSLRLGDKQLETHDHRFYFPTEHPRLWSLYNILSDERMSLSFTIAAGPRPRSHSQVRVLRGSRPHFAVSDSRLPQTWRVRSPYLYPPGTEWSSYTPRHWVRCLSEFLSVLTVD
jgi:hypothetical protein